MKRRTMILSLLLASLMFLAGTASLGVAGDSDVEPTRSSRATPIDGEFIDEFDDDGNVTLKDDAGVVDGALTIDRRFLDDEFDRFILAPWVGAEGTPRIYNGVLLTNATEASNATARASMDHHDFQLTLDLSPGLLTNRGPTILVRGGSIDPLVFGFDYTSDDIIIARYEAGTLVTLSSSRVLMQKDGWYSASIEVIGRELMFSMAGGMTSTSLDVLGDFNAIELQAPSGDNVAWDNVTLSKMGGSGTATTTKVFLPENTFWSGLSITFIKSPVTTLEMSILDASTGLPISGLEDIKSQYTNVRDLLDPLVHSAIQLRVEMEANATSAPSISYWKVSWVGDPPQFVLPIPEVTLKEDEFGDDVLDLRQYFDDYLTDDGNLTYSVSYISNANNVKPVVDGYMLDFELPNENWHGSEQYRILCSDGTLEKEGLEASVVVEPVDDPPVIKSIPRIVMDEDTEKTIVITPFLEDVDTPVDALSVLANSDHATVVGQEITLFYDTGGITELIELQVSDYNTFGTGYLDVVVTEVDDAPVIAEIDDERLDEDMERQVDLAGHVSDEETELEDLIITIPDADEYVSMDGMVIILFYGDTGGEFNYTIQVSDGNNTASTVFRVTVIEINDPPVIASVGDHTPVEDEMDYYLVEGNSTSLVIAVEDEEGAEIAYTLISKFDGASMDGGTLSLVSQIGQIGSYTIQLAVSDGGAADLVIINLEITNRNDPPKDVSINSPEDNSTFENGTEVTFTGFSFDPDTTYGDVVEYLWASDRDGDLGKGKTIKVSDLSVGVHEITMRATDGELWVDVSIKVTITAKDGNGGGPGTNGDGDGGGGGDDGGISTGLLVALLLVVLVVVGVMLFVMRGRGAGAGADAAPEDVDAGEDEVTTTDSPAPDQPLPELELDQEQPVDEAESMYAQDYVAADEAASMYAKDHVAADEAGTDVEPDTAGAPEPAPDVPVSYEAVAVDTAALAGDDPEQKQLDDLKREYQTAISALPYGVPAKELQGMDWFEVAAALATGEKRELEDGRTVTRIGDNWFYSDTEDTSSFLKLHE